MPKEWFTERINVKILYENKDVWEEVTVISKEHAGWLFESQKWGYSYTDVPPKDNVCVACEG